MRNISAEVMSYGRCIISSRENVVRMRKSGQQSSLYEVDSKVQDSSRNNHSEQKNLYGVFRNIMRNLKKEEDGLAEFVLTTNDDDNAYKNELRWKISKQI